MKLYPYWLSAATVAALLFVCSMAMPARATPPTFSMAARAGLNLGLLTSSGALAAPEPTETPPPGDVTAESPAAAEAPPDDVSTDSPAAAEPLAEVAPTPAEPAAEGVGGAAAAPGEAVVVKEPPPAEIPATPTPAPKGKKVFVDAGHGGAEIGSVHGAGGAEDLIEKQVNLAIALRLADLLRADGYDVQISRTSDRAVLPGAGMAADLQARVDMANRFGADAFVSVHHNGNDNHSLKGTEVYYCGSRSYGAENRRLASLVQEALVRNMRQAGYDAVDRGIQDDARLGHLALLALYNLARPSRMPAIIGEALFISNDDDAAALQRADIREAIARGYCEGIKAYFGDSQ